MKKKFSTLKQLTKTEQRNIKGGGQCDGYTGPIVVTCEQYHNLPPQYQGCVLVSVDCFPR
ncbi:hypothetical protein BKI52_03600 [marine bacterium AO1-C]|nr:hypothetical protein BKI52_03600 [marine bacterium AO1-C]